MQKLMQLCLLLAEIQFLASTCLLCSIIFGLHLAILVECHIKLSTSISESLSRSGGGTATGKYKLVIYQCI